jgi:DNA-binding MarR family transcriptional regulator
MLFEETIAGHMIELIWRIYFLSKKVIDQNLKKFNLTYPQFGTLVALSKNENISQRKLAEFFRIDTTNMMVICDSLQKKELIQRKSNPKDRRENLIVRTEHGKNLTQKAMKEMEGYVKQITSQLKQKDIASVMPVLKKLHDSLLGSER